MSDFLPQDILKQILLRLPLPSLSKCLSVSKQWLSIITSPSFISAHAASSPSSLLLSYFTEPPKTQFFSFDFNPKVPSFRPKTLRSPFRITGNFFFRIVGSLHGLLCLSDDYFGNTHVVVLWNPSIKRCVLLPESAVFASSLRDDYIFVLGFGFDAKRNDYKVVRSGYVKRNNGPPKQGDLPPRVEVFSLKDGKWREIKAVGVKYCICEKEWSQCFMYGCVHWIAYEYKSGGRIECSILMFDVSDEKFKKMRLPENVFDDCPMNLNIAEIGGKLAVLQYGNGKWCDVWVRKEYGVAKSWTQMYNVDMEEGVGKIVSLRPTGEILVATHDGKLVSYDAKSGVTEDLGIEGIDEAFYVQDYTESLVLLDKESNAISYGGPKKDCEKKREKNKSTSTSSELLEDTSSILISEDTDGNMEADLSARYALFQETISYMTIRMDVFGLFETARDGSLAQWIVPYIYSTVGCSF